MLEFVSMYSRQFDHVNRDIVKGIREKDDMASAIEETCLELSRTIPDNIKYLGYTFDDSGRVMREINKTKGKDKKEVKSSVSVDQTFARLAVYKFKLKFDGETRIVEMPIYIPLFIDGYHYLIRGNKYSAPYQITDAVTYTNKEDMVVIKFMTRAIKMSREKCNLSDVHGGVHQAHQFYLHLTSKKVPFLLYYFAHFGFMRTHTYFGVEKLIGFREDYPIEPEEDKIFFKFGTLYMWVNREHFDISYIFRQYVATVLALGKKGINQETVQRVTYWKTILGASISETKTLEKGQGLLSTFIVALDHRTMETIDKLVGHKGFKRESMFSVVRWLFLNYSEAVAKSSSLENKRIRLSEYQVTPLIRILYHKLYRFMNTSAKTRDMRRLTDIFKVSPSIIINAIIGKTRSKNGSLNIAKFSSYTNDFALINVGLKYTSAGPGSPMENSGKMVGDKYRRFDVSNVGRTCLITTSNSDPGISGVLVPSAQIDLDTMTFKPIQ